METESGTAMEPLGGIAPRGLEVTRVEYWVNKVQVKNIRELFGDAEVFMLGHFVGDAGEPKVSELSVTRHVKKGSFLEIAKGGMNMYATDPGSVPSLVNYRIQVMESDADYREWAPRLRKALSDPRYREMRDKILETLLKGRLDLVLVSKFLDFSVDLVADALEANKDDQLINHAGSLTARNLYGAGSEQFEDFDDVNFWYQTYVTTSGEDRI